MKSILSKHQLKYMAISVLFGNRIYIFADIEPIISNKLYFRPRGLRFIQKYEVGFILKYFNSNNLLAENCLFGNVCPLPIVQYFENFGFMSIAGLRRPVGTLVLMVGAPSKVWSWLLHCCFQIKFLIIRLPSHQIFLHAIYFHECII